MTLGPVQLITIGFKPTDRCLRRILRELRELKCYGIIRVLDLLIVKKDSQGTLTRMEGFQPLNNELGRSGQVLSILIGLDTRDSAISPSTNVDALSFAEHNFGVSRKDIMSITDQLASGLGAALLLVEHQWESRLKAAVRAAGGWMLAQSLVTPEALLWVGDEVQARAEVEAAIELRSAVEGAALLDALADIAENALMQEPAISAETAAVSAATAATARTAIAAQAIRALIVGDLIAEAAAR